LNQISNSDINIKKNKINTERSDKTLHNYKSQIHSFISNYKNKNFSPAIGTNISDEVKKLSDFSLNNINEDTDCNNNKSLSFIDEFGNRTNINI